MLREVREHNNQPSTGVAKTIDGQAKRKRIATASGNGVKREQRPCAESVDDCTAAGADMVEGVEVVLLFDSIMQHGIILHAVEGPAQIIQLNYEHEDIGCGDIIINNDTHNFSCEILFLPHGPTRNGTLPSYKGQRVTSQPFLMADKQFFNNTSFIELD